MVASNAQRSKLLLLAQPQVITNDTHKPNPSRKLDKELTEAYSAYRQIKHLLQNSQFDPSQLLFFDICSGKGYLSVLLAYEFPESQIYMIDNDEKMNVEHLQSIPNISLLSWNLRSPKYVSDLSKMIPDGKYAMMVGIRLCGVLSQIFVDSFNRLDAIRWFVLVPCCIPKCEEELKQRAKLEKLNNYGLWTLRVVALVDKEKIQFTSVCMDDCVLSIKNNYIVAAKSGMIVEEALASWPPMNADLEFQITHSDASGAH